MDLYLKSCMAIFNFYFYDLIFFSDVYISEFENKESQVKDTRTSERGE